MEFQPLIQRRCQRIGTSSFLFPVPFVLLTIGISRKNICMYHAFTSACLSQQVAPNSPWRSKPLCSSSAQSSADGLAAEECNFLRTPYNSIFGCSQKTRIEFLSYHTGFWAAFYPFLTFLTTIIYFIVCFRYCTAEQRIWESRSHLAGARKSGWRARE